jgi:hypothetical protein
MSRVKGIERFKRKFVDPHAYFGQPWFSGEEAMKDQFEVPRGLVNSAHEVFPARSRLRLLNRSVKALPDYKCAFTPEVFDERDVGCIIAYLQGPLVCLCDEIEVPRCHSRFSTLARDYSQSSALGEGGCLQAKPESS